MKYLIFAVSFWSSVAAAGPISKFDNRKPEAVLTTERAIGDVERCLIDLDGVPAPQVYRQPDQPDRVTLLWMNPGAMNGLAIGKADLKKIGPRVQLTLWLKDKSAQRCAQ